MSRAIEQIVAAYVELGQLGSLQDLKSHRERLAASVRPRTDFDFGVLLGQIDDDLAAIEAGIRRLREQTVARLEAGFDGQLAAADVLSALQRR